MKVERESPSSTSNKSAPPADVAFYEITPVDDSLQWRRGPAPFGHE